MSVRMPLPKFQKRGYGTLHFKKLGTPKITPMRGQRITTETRNSAVAAKLRDAFVQMQ